MPVLPELMESPAASVTVAFWLRLTATSPLLALPRPLVPVPPGGAVPRLLGVAEMPILTPATIVSGPSLTVIFPLLLLKATMPEPPPETEAALTLLTITSALLSITTLPQVLVELLVPYPAQMPLAA